MRYNFSQPMKDNVEEAVSGVRGKVVLKIFGPDLEKMRTTLEQAKETLKPVPGIVDLDLYRDASTPQLQMRFDRQALARAGITMEDAQRTLETALAGRVVDDHVGRRAAGAGAPDDCRSTVRDDPEKIGAVTIAGECRRANSAARPGADLQVANGLAIDQPRRQQPLPRA